MVAHTTSDKGVVFSFSVEVGVNMRREEFQWRKIEKGKDSMVKEGGFKLVRLASRSEAGEGASQSGTRAPRLSEDDDGETVALLEWGKNSIFSRQAWSFAHGLSLQLTGRKAGGTRRAMVHNGCHHSLTTLPLAFPDEGL